MPHLGKSPYWLLITLLYGLVGAWCEQPSHGGVAADRLSAALEVLRSVDGQGQRNVAAADAWKVTAQADGEQVPLILLAMKDAGPISINYLRAAVDTIVQRERREGKSLSIDTLRAFYDNLNNSPRARRTAYELMCDLDPATTDELVPRALNDPSLEMRYDAVARKTDQAKELLRANDQQAAVRAFRQAFDAARDLDQVQYAAKKLRELGQEANLPQHFGFVMKWHVIGPFDNTGTRGFDAVYAPEMAVDLQAACEGKSGSVQWKPIVVEDELGVVDLNAALGAHKGAVAYAYAEFHSDEARQVEVRLGSLSANKVWVNNDLVTANHVYHAGMEVDQYTGPATLHRGKNTILVKIAQNEQTESWAADWKFQLRVCDELGTAVRPSDTPHEN